VLADSDDPELASIAAMAQEPEEEHRYGSVAALIADLDRWRAQFPVTSMPGGLNYRAGKFVDRHKKGVLATGVALVLLSATSIVATKNYYTAETARAEAIARADDTRGTTRFMLFDVLDQLEAKPNSLALRVQIAGKAQQALDRIADAPGASEVQRLEAAAALLKLSQYQAKVGRPNLRQIEPARANLTRAAAIAVKIRTVTAKTLLAQILMDHALLVLNFDNDTDAGEKLLASAGTLITALPHASNELIGQYRRTMGNLRGWQGKYADEVSEARAGLAVPRLADPKRDYLFRNTLVDLEGEGLFYLNRLDDAESAYRKQLALLQAAQRRWPGDNYILGRVALACWNLGVALEQMKRFEEALPVLARGAADADRFVAFDPADQEARRSRRMIRQAYAQNLAYLKRVDEALPIFQEFENEAVEGLRAFPKDPSRLRDYAMAVVMTGEGLAAGGRVAEGCATDARALALFLQLKAVGKLTGFDASYNIKQLKARDAELCKGQAARSR
jgi:eukaryotic-like serine/threonine-protein kinase